MDTKRYELNKQLAQMLKGGVIMDVTTPEQARIAEEAGACAVMALERIPADIRAAGGVATPADAALMMQLGAEGVDVAGHQPTEEEPVNACLDIFIPISHRAHPPAGSVVAGEVVDEAPGGAEETDGQRQGDEGQQVPVAPAVEEDVANQADERHQREHGQGGDLRGLASEKVGESALPELLVGSSLHHRMDKDDVRHKATDADADKPVEAQATDRAYRIGQHSNVIVHRFITKNTFEEKIDQLIQSKRELAELTVNVGENWVGNMSNRELEELFKFTGSGTDGEEQ